MHMEKVSVDLSKHFCPHPMPLFIFGTYTEEKKPNFGLFCWMNFCWDGELSVMVCLDGEKLTKDCIKRTKVFSANLVTESMLPLADYLGHTKGYDPEKAPGEITVVQGQVLDVPVFEKSPLSYELEVSKIISLDGSDIFICHIRNTVVDKSILVDKDNYDLSLVLPAITSLESYFAMDKNSKKGNWGDWKVR